MLETHKSFKSVYTDDEIRNAEQYIKDAIAHQDTFDRNTTPGEIPAWDGDKLNNFKVDLKKVDRLYYVDSNRVIGRMEYDHHRPIIIIYFELIVEDDGDGKIYISQDANLFMNVINLTDEMPVDLIHQSLAEDKIVLDDMRAYDKKTRFDDYMRFVEAKIAYDNCELCYSYIAQLLWN